MKTPTLFELAAQAIIDAAFKEAYAAQQADACKVPYLDFTPDGERILQQHIAATLRVSRTDHV